jgi:hypothetical protein
MQAVGRQPMMSGGSSIRERSRKLLSRDEHAAGMQVRRGRSRGVRVEHAPNQGGGAGIDGVISTAAEDKQPPAKNARERMQVRILRPARPAAGGQGRRSGAHEVARQSGWLITPSVGDQLAVRGV